MPLRRSISILTHSLRGDEIDIDASNWSGSLMSMLGACKELLRIKGPFGAKLEAA
jgi:hypothetical protein